MIILIDNYDSFVYNLARYVSQLGFEHKVVRNNKITLADIKEYAPTHLIISPGPCAPKQAGISLDTVRHFAGRIPILGVCLGHQAIAEAFGGNVIHAKKPMHGKRCFIEHSKEGILQGINNPLEVARYHSLVVDPATLPDCLHVTAYSEEKEIMALAHKEYPIYGLQFHPESILTQQGYQVLNNFLQCTKSAAL